jgi:hypothetical protein
LDNKYLDHTNSGQKKELEGDSRDSRHD